MARPIKHRRICQLPQTCEFLPVDAPTADGVLLTIDEFESVRLIDYMGLSQEDCAQQMNVARTTVQSIYNTARKKVAEALVCGKRLCIGGGTYEVCPQADSCCGKSCQTPSCGGKRCKQGPCGCHQHS